MKIPKHITRFTRTGPKKQPEPNGEPIGRSENMRRIGSRDTKPELLLRRALHKRGFRYRIHVPNLPGKPDIVFGSRRLVIFVHGCFWHQHPNCQQASDPRTNRDYWTPKLQRNVRRDREHITKIRSLGYATLIIWECEIEKDPESAADRVVLALTHRQEKV